MDGTILKKWREDNGVSQVEFAEQVGKSQPWVSKIERQGLQKIGSLVKISEKTGIPLSDLA